MEDDYVLVVGEGPAADEAEMALSRSHKTKRCLGSTVGYCPAVHRQTCTLRTDASVAVVFLAGEHEFHAPGQWTCVSGGASPAVAVLEGSSFPIQGSNGFAIVGSAMGPAAVVDAVECALHEGAEHEELI